jgi:hypothetical protein
MNCFDTLVLRYPSAIREWVANVHQCQSLDVFIRISSNGTPLTDYVCVSLNSSVDSKEDGIIKILLPIDDEPREKRPFSIDLHVSNESVQVASSCTSSLQRSAWIEFTIPLRFNNALIKELDLKACIVPSTLHPTDLSINSLNPLVDPIYHSRNEVKITLSELLFSEIIYSASSHDMFSSKNIFDLSFYACLSRGTGDLMTIPQRFPSTCRIQDGNLVWDNEFMSNSVTLNLLNEVDVTSNDVHLLVYVSSFSGTSSIETIVAFSYLNLYELIDGTCVSISDLRYPIEQMKGIQSLPSVFDGDVKVSALLNVYIGSPPFLPANEDGSASLFNPSPCGDIVGPDVFGYSTFDSLQRPIPSHLQLLLSSFDGKLFQESKQETGFFPIAMKIDLLFLDEIRHFDGDDSYNYSVHQSKLSPSLFLSQPYYSFMHLKLILFNLDMVIKDILLDLFPTNASYRHSGCLLSSSIESLASQILNRSMNASDNYSLMNRTMKAFGSFSTSLVQTLMKSYENDATFALMGALICSSYFGDIDQIETSQLDSISNVLSPVVFDLYIRLSLRLVQKQLLSRGDRKGILSTLFDLTSSLGLLMYQLSSSNGAFGSHANAILYPETDSFNKLQSTRPDSIGDFYSYSPLQFLQSSFHHIFSSFAQIIGEKNPMTDADKVSLLHVFQHHLVFLVYVGSSSEVPAIKLMYQMSIQPFIIDFFSFLTSQSNNSTDHLKSLKLQDNNVSVIGMNDVLRKYRANINPDVNIVSRKTNDNLSLISNDIASRQINEPDSLVTPESISVLLNICSTSLEEQYQSLLLSMLSKVHQSSSSIGAKRVSFVFILFGLKVIQLPSLPSAKVLELLSSILKLRISTSSLSFVEQYAAEQSIRDILQFIMSERFKFHPDDYVLMRILLDVASSLHMLSQSDLTISVDLSKLNNFDNVLISSLKSKFLKHDIHLAEPFDVSKLLQTSIHVLCNKFFSHVKLSTQNTMLVVDQMISSFQNTSLRGKSIPFQSLGDLLVYSTVNCLDMNVMSTFISLTCPNLIDFEGCMGIVTVYVNNLSLFDKIEPFAGSILMEYLSSKWNNKISDKIIDSLQQKIFEALDTSQQSPPLSLSGLRQFLVFGKDERFSILSSSVAAVLCLSNSEQSSLPASHSYSILSNLQSLLELCNNVRPDLTPQYCDLVLKKLGWQFGVPFTVLLQKSPSNLLCIMNLFTFKTMVLANHLSSIRHNVSDLDLLPLLKDIEASASLAVEAGITCGSWSLVGGTSHVLHWACMKVLQYLGLSESSSSSYTNYTNFNSPASPSKLVVDTERRQLAVTVRKASRHTAYDQQGGQEFSPSLVSDFAISLGKQASAIAALCKYIQGCITNHALSQVDQNVIKVPDMFLNVVLRFTSSDNSKQSADPKLIQLHPFSAALRTLLVLSSNGIVTPNQIFTHVLVFLKGPSFSREFGASANGKWKLIRVSMDSSPVDHVKSMFEDAYPQASFVLSNTPVVVSEVGENAFEFLGVDEHASSALWARVNSPVLSDIIYIFPTQFEGATGKSLFSRSSTVLSRHPVNKFGMYRIQTHPVSSSGPCLLSGKFDVSKHDPDSMINISDHNSSLMQVDYFLKSGSVDRMPFLVDSSQQFLSSSMSVSLKTCIHWVTGICTVHVNSIKPVPPVSSLTNWIQNDIRIIRGLGYWLNNVLVTTNPASTYIPLSTITSTSRKIEPVKLETATHLLLKYDVESDETSVAYRTGPGVTHAAASIFSITPTQTVPQKLPALSLTTLHKSEVDGTLPAIAPLVSINQAQISFTVGSIPLSSFVAPLCNVEFLKSVLSNFSTSYLTSSSIELLTSKQYLLDYYELKRVWKERKVTEMRRNWIREDTAMKQAGYDTSTRNMPDFASNLETGPHSTIILLERNYITCQSLLAEILGVLKTLK